MSQLTLQVLPSEALVKVRIAARLGAHFLLEMQKALGGRDITDSLILVATVQANLGPILADVTLQRAYAGADQPPPDHLRRPISVNALASSLSLPFETVRRRVRSLVDAGWCRMTPLGVVVPEPALVTPGHVRMLEDNYLAVRKLYGELRLADCLRRPARSDVEPCHEQPVRAVARLSSDYALRMIEPFTSHLGDVTDGFLLLAIHGLNTEHLSAQLREEIRRVDRFLPDSMRRPAAISQIAERLGLGYELVRRRIRRLQREGRCEVVTGGGIILPASGFARAGMAAFVSSNQSNLQRLFAGVAQLGIIEAWERDLVRPLETAAAGLADGSRNAVPDPRFE